MRARGASSSSLKEGGRSLISVADDGCGMTAEELALAVERHCTSKLPNDDLGDIRTLGFRGEALPSIASVSRFSIVSRPADAGEAWGLEIEGGVKRDAKPAAHPPGTRVEVRDLFFATPARLKFLKAAADRSRPCRRRLAPARDGASPHRVSPRQRGAGADRPCSGRAVAARAAQAARLARLAAIMGRDFADNALAIDANREGFRLTGLRRPADPQPTDRAAPVPVRERPAGARQAARRCRARCLPGFPGARPPSHGGPVPRGAGRAGRRQCAPRQDRGALPRRRRWCAG